MKDVKQAMPKTLPKALLTAGWILPLLAGAETPRQQAIYWPGKLVGGADQLSINEIRISMDCAEFRGVRNIPADWNVEVIRPISAKAEMHLSAGHGASDLRNLKELDGAIVIGEQDGECFNLKVTIVTEDGQIHLDGSELKFVTIKSGSRK
jgi:hypothetical protein